MSLLARRLIGIAVFAAIALVIGSAASLQWQLSITMAVLACMGAAALNLLMGTAGQASIGSAGMLAAGAFSTVWLTHAGVPFPLDVGIAATFTGAIGLVVGIPALRLRGLYLALATLAAHFVILFVALQYQNAAAGPEGFIIPYVIPGTMREAQSSWLIIIVVVASLTLALVAILMDGRTGRTWRMVRDHEVVAPTFGISTTRWKLAAFVISSVIFGLQGSILVHYTGALTTESFTLAVAISYIAMVVVGGLDTIAGAIVGALTITLLPTVLQESLRSLEGVGVSPAAGAHLGHVVYGALILVFVVFMPGGIANAVAKLVRTRLRRSSSDPDPAAGAPSSSSTEA